MSHPNLSDAINRNIAQSEKNGGLMVDDIPEGAVLGVRTRNTLYEITRTGNQTRIQGHPHYCPTPVDCSIAGSTWGGSMLKMGWIGLGMHLEFTIPGHQGPITTSAIQHIGFRDQDDPA